MTESDATSLPHRTGDVPKPPPAPVSPRALSADLRALAAHFQGGPVRRAEVVEVLKNRGYRFLMVLLCLPFLRPIPLPVVSTVIGLVIALIGLCLALGQKPHLPQSLMRKEPPPRLLPKVLRASSRLVGAFERLSKPRPQRFYWHAAFQRLGGVLIALCGLELLLPLPIPLSNFFPGISAALLAAGSFAEDGLAFLVGLLMFTASPACFALLALGGTAAIGEIWQRGLGS